MDNPTHEEVITQRVQDFTESFTGSGLRTYKFLSAFCLEHTNTYVPDSDKTIFNAGARSVILEISHWLDYDLTKFGKETDEYNRIS